MLAIGISTLVTSESGHPRDYLVEQNIKLVYREAHRYKRQGVLSFDELVSEGLLALMRCARCESYDPAESEFSSYAVPSIRRQMWHAIRNREKTRIHQEPEFDRDSDHAPALETLALEREPRLDDEQSQSLCRVLSVVTDYERDLVHQLYVEEISITKIAKRERKEVCEIRKMIDTAIYKLRLQANRAKQSKMKHERKLAA